MIRPNSPEELAQTLADCSLAGRTIQLGGALSKQAMAGPVEPADAVISTTAMMRVLQYEPADLTISVEAGMRWADLTELLARNKQMIPLDPPFSGSATVGGVVAANTSGPRRRLYGTARDVVIGMKFATLEGKMVHSGGMVVKNVAGLDMAKLMIGSFGTLAAIAVVNFKLAPIPVATRTFVISHRTLAEAIATRDRILQQCAAALRIGSGESGGSGSPGPGWVLRAVAGRGERGRDATVYGRINRRRGVRG